MSKTPIPRSKARIFDKKELERQLKQQDDTIKEQQDLILVLEDDQLLNLTKKEAIKGNLWLDRYHHLTDNRIVIQESKPPDRPPPPVPQNIPMQEPGEFVPPVRQLPKFTDTFTEDKLTKLGKDTDRGRLKGRRGKFEEPYQQALTIFNEYGRYLSGGEDPPEQMCPKMIEDLKELQTKAQEWLNSKGDDNLDDTARAKIDACKDMVRLSRLAWQQLRLKEIERQYPDLQTAPPETRDEFLMLDAEMLRASIEPERAGTGTSEVSLIKGPDGKVVYAFKSVEGESRQMGIPKGSGALRETLTSQLCSVLDQKWDLGFKWPGARLGKLSGENGDTLGVLIDGMSGVPGQTVPGEVLERVQPEDLQKVALCNLAFGQFDVKWDNVFVNDTGGKVELTPYDGGAALPNKHLLVTQLLGGSMDDLGKPLLFDNQGNALPQAQENIAPELREKFLSINPDELVRDCDESLARMQALGLDPGQLGAREGLDFARESIQQIQEILRQNEQISLSNLIDQYREEFLKPRTRDLVDDWEKDIRAQYKVLWKQHPKLLPAPPPEHEEEKNTNDPHSLFTYFLDPFEREHLTLLEKVGGVDMLNKYKITLPLKGGFKVGVERLKAKLTQKYRSKEEREKKFPDLYPPK
jgi:hypothetical protein